MPDPKPAKKTSAKPAPARTGPRKPQAPEPAPAAGYSEAGEAADSAEASDSIGSIAEETGSLIGVYLKDMAETSAATLASVQAGKYKVEDVWADGIKLWVNSVTGMTKAFELGTRAVKLAATKSDDVS